jgi:hypothetical protein
MGLHMELVIGAARSFPWTAEIGSVLFGLVVLWVGVRTWIGKRPWSNTELEHDRRSLRLVASTLPGAVFFLSLALVIPTGFWVGSTSGTIGVVMQISFVAFSLVCLVCFAAIIYIFVRRIPNGLIPPARRNSSLNT